MSRFKCDRSAFNFFAKAAFVRFRGSNWSKYFSPTMAFLINRTEEADSSVDEAVLSAASFASRHGSFESVRVVSLFLIVRVWNGLPCLLQLSGNSTKQTGLDCPEDCELLDVGTDGPVHR